MLNILIIFLNLKIILTIGYQIIDDISFNLMNYQDVQTIYNNYTRDGDTLIYKNNLILAPRLNNTHGLLYSKRVNIH